MWGVFWLQIYSQIPLSPHLNWILHEKKLGLITTEKTAITCFIKLFVILKYNSFEVPLSSKLPMLRSMHASKTQLYGRAALPESTILIKITWNHVKTEWTKHFKSNIYITQGETQPYIKSWITHNISGSLDLKSPV